MLCSKCKIEMREIKVDYKYIESGLNNVILQGISAYECPKCRETNPIIPRIKELNKVIAHQLINKTSLLTGKELIYLRKEMKIKAQDLAQILGVTKVTVSRWENEKEQISPTCDRLIRILYDNRIFNQTCAIVRPGIEKLGSPAIKSMLISLCEPKTSIEYVFRNIKRRRVHSKISIPISKLDILTDAIHSPLLGEFVDGGALMRFGRAARAFGTTTTTAVGTVTASTVVTTATVDPSTSSLNSFINSPDEPAWAPAYIN